MKLWPRFALITGVTGQDGLCLFEFLIKKGCNVRAVVRAYLELRHTAVRPIKRKVKYGGTEMGCEAAQSARWRTT